MSQKLSINKNIYILWFQSFESSPDVIKLCLRSWLIHNPDWKIHQIDENNLSEYIELDDFLTRKFKSNSITRTSLSDIIRLKILHKYGGLWIDATVFCTKPLNDWIEEYIQNGFFAYDGKPETELIIGSWFIYAEKNNYMIDRWLTKALEYCSHTLNIGMQNPKLTYREWKQDNTIHYFWVHYLFKDLYESDQEFKAQWDAIPKLKADNVHDIPNIINHALDRSSKNRIDSKLDNVYKLWNPNRVTYPHIQDSVYHYVRSSIPHHTYILIAYYESNMGRRNLEYLLKRTILNSNRTLCIIVNGAITLDIPTNIRVIHRPNSGYDFGAWGQAINELDLLNSMQEDDRLIMINLSIRGPYFHESDIYQDWIRRFEMLITSDVKLGGISINCFNAKLQNVYQNVYNDLNCDGVTKYPYIPHVQSMLMVTDRVGLRIGTENNIFNGDTDDRFVTIAKKEMRYSIEILRNAYNINCILPKYRNFDYRKTENHDKNSNNNNNSDPWWNHAYFCQTINPYQSIFIKSNLAINYYHLISIDYKGMGLMNQMITIINGILDAQRNGNFKIIISNFRPDYRSDQSIPISDVLDIRSMNSALNMLNKFPEILDISQCDIQYCYSTYGTIYKYVTVDNSKFPIRTDQNINRILTDPDPFKKKELRIFFNINDIPYTKRIKEFNEYIKETAYGNKSDITSNSKMGWYDRSGFIDILKTLKFNSKFYNIVDTLIPSDDSMLDLNVIHLRIEEDGITHWAKQNIMNKDDFRSKLEAIYLFYTRLLIPPGQKILVLTGDSNAEILRILKEEYSIITLDPTTLIKEKFGYEGRELNAIIDYLAGQKCRNVFIGCHSLKLKRGSSFSYFLHQTMNNTLSLLIDLDDLKQPAEILTR